MIPSYIVDFKRTWEEMGEDNEVVETYQLTSVASIKGGLLYLKHIK